MHKQLSILLATCAVVFGSCSKPTEQIVPLGEFPISETAIPNAVFTGINRQMKLSWHNDLNSILYDDVVLKIVRCDNEDYLICIVHPYPIFLPKQLAKKRRIVQESHVYEISMSLERGRSLKTRTCDNFSLWLKVTNKSTDVSYWYLFVKDIGIVKILTFQKGQALPEVPENLFGLSQGKLFALDDVCEEDRWQNDEKRK